MMRRRNIHKKIDATSRFLACRGLSKFGHMNNFNSSHIPSFPQFEPRPFSRVLTVSMTFIFCRTIKMIKGGVKFDAPLQLRNVVFCSISANSFLFLKLSEVRRPLFKECNNSLFLCSQLYQLLFRDSENSEYFGHCSNLSDTTATLCNSPLYAEKGQHLLGCFLCMIFVRSLSLACLLQSTTANEKERVAFRTLGFIRVFIILVNSLSI